MSTLVKTVAIEPPVWSMLKELSGLMGKSQKAALAEIVKQKLIEYKKENKTDFIDWYKNDFNPQKIKGYKPKRNYSDIEEMEDDNVYY